MRDHVPFPFVRLSPAVAVYSSFVFFVFQGESGTSANRLFALLLLLGSPFEFTLRKLLVLSGLDERSHQLLLLRPAGREPETAAVWTWPPWVPVRRGFRKGTQALFFRWSLDGPDGLHALGFVPFGFVELFSLPSDGSGEHAYRLG